MAEKVHNHLTKTKPVHGHSTMTEKSPQSLRHDRKSPQ